MFFSSIYWHKFISDFMSPVFTLSQELNPSLVQRKVLKLYVHENNLIVFDEYVDYSWSGTNFERPAFQHLMEDVKTGKINYIITKDDCVNIELKSESPQKAGFCDVSSVF